MPGLAATGDRIMRSNRRCANRPQYFTSRLTGDIDIRYIVIVTAFERTVNARRSQEKETT
jgi:hypothetical protein